MVKIGLTNIRYIDSDTMQPITGLLAGTTDFVFNLENGQLFACETDLSDPILATCEKTSQTKEKAKGEIIDIQSDSRWLAVAHSVNSQTL